MWWNAERSINHAQRGAEGGIRTRTGLLPPDPEPGVSASSTTSAIKFKKLNIKNQNCGRLSRLRIKK